MSATLAPFGLRPAYHPSGLDRAQGLANVIQSTYAQNILKGQAVKLDPTTGYVVRAASGDPIYGVFDGVEWTDTTGRRRVSNCWPSGTAYQTGSLIAYIWTDPQVVYEIQAEGSIAQTALGQEFDITNPYNPTTVIRRWWVCLKPPWVQLLLALTQPRLCALSIWHRILAMHGVIRTRSFVCKSLSSSTLVFTKVRRLHTP